MNTTTTAQTIHTAREIADQIVETARQLAADADVVDHFDAARKKALNFLTAKATSLNTITVTVTGQAPASLCTYDSIARSAITEAVDHLYDMRADSCHIVDVAGKPTAVVYLGVDIA